MSIPLHCHDRVAVIGSGVSGLLAARLLATRAQVTLFEAAACVGGHTCTIDVPVEDRTVPVDTGFMVFNERTYPHLVRLLELLGVPSRESDMSFSVRCDRTGWEFCGTSWAGLLASWANVWDWRFYRMLWDVLRFNREASAAGQRMDDRLTLRQWLADEGYSQAFSDQYLTAMGASIWSTSPDGFLDFSARFIIRFFENHGLLQASGHFPWRTIVGGSRTYAERLTQPLGERVRVGTPIAAVARDAEGVWVRPVCGMAERFEHVVIATHSDQALRMLVDATEGERSVLGSIMYSPNEMLIHTDRRLLPRAEAAWASWNYHVAEAADQPASVTYDLTRLQGLPGETRILGTMNESDSVEPSQVLARLNFAHPLLTAAAAAAQRRRREIDGVGRTHFCGAYWGSGFHEDGVRSALHVAARFGLTLDDVVRAVCPRTPSPAPAGAV